MSSKKVELQRDLYLHLLRADEQKDSEISTFLNKALEIICKLSKAKQGYMELKNDDDPSVWSAWGFDSEEIENIQTAISSGIVDQVLQSGKPVVTSSAVMDPRFRERQSVYNAKIQAVLCAPIGGFQQKGVLYLQGDPSFDPESAENMMNADVFTKQVYPMLSRLAQYREESQSNDPTASFRSKLQLEDVVGQSEALAEMLRSISMIAALDVGILLTGESGTGKSQIAGVIHKNSPRNSHPFIELNCGALPENLIENELFGSVAGGHSSALKPVEGKIMAAEGGTLFLDEIGELPLNAQVKLLQFLQTGEFFPLGASKPVRANVRVLTATNVKLEEAVQKKQFREDLYYRIKIFPIQVPALRDRLDDIPKLAAYFCQEKCTKHNFSSLSINCEVFQELQALSWPGNVRELSHVVEAACISASCSGEGEILLKHLPKTGLETDNFFAELNFQKATRSFQEKFLKRQLERNNWNISQVAKEINLSRSQVNNLIKSFSLVRP